MNPAAMSMSEVLLLLLGFVQLAATQDEAITVDPGWEDGGSIGEPSSPSTIVVQSPIVTNWGHWGRWAHCSRTHSFVTGFALKVEPQEPGIDNTGVNGISLSCGVAEQHEIERISSSKGPWGTWRTRQFCGNSPAVGFQLKVQHPQGSNVDDAATVNVRMLCGSGNVLQGHEEPEDYVKADWSEAIQCPPNTAVCGMQTQVEPRQWLADDTTLNNIRIKCCALPTQDNQQEQQLPGGAPPFRTTALPENKPIPVYNPPRP